MSNDTNHPVPVTKLDNLIRPVAWIGMKTPLFAKLNNVPIITIFKKHEEYSGTTSNQIFRMKSRLLKTGTAIIENRIRVY